MNGSCRSGAIFLLVITGIPALSCAAAPAATPTAAPATAPATTPTTAPAMPHAGDSITIDALLDYYAEHFDIIFAKNGPLKKEVVLRQDIPKDVDSALSELDILLATQSLGTWRVHRNPAPGEQTSGRILLQVLTVNEVKAKERDESPVTSGTDPGRIDISERDKIITHLVPISNADLVDAARRAALDEKDVTATVLGSAQSGYQLVLTGPALSVRRAVAAVVGVDQPTEKITPVVRNLHLDNIDAAESVVTINQLYGPNILGDKAVRAVADKRTNTIILTGPEAQVLRVIGDLTVQDKGPLPTAPRNRAGGRLPDSLVPPMLRPLPMANAAGPRIMSIVVQNPDSNAITVHPVSVSSENKAI